MANKGKQMWISPDGKDWTAHLAGQQGDVARFENKAEALDFGTKLGKILNLELVVQKKNGEIQERRSYGNDPFPPRG